jgi:hypothetical protein
MAELRSYENGSLSQRIRGNPPPHLRALEAACHELATENRPGYDKHGRFPAAWEAYVMYSLYFLFSSTLHIAGISFWRRVRC